MLSENIELEEKSLKRDRSIVREGDNAIEDIDVRGAHIEAASKYKRGIFAKWSRTQNIQDMHPLD